MTSSYTILPFSSQWTIKLILKLLFWEKFTSVALRVSAQHKTDERKRQINQLPFCHFAQENVFMFDSICLKICHGSHVVQCLYRLSVMCVVASCGLFQWHFLGHFTVLWKSFYTQRGFFFTILYILIDFLNWDSFTFTKAKHKWEESMGVLFPTSLDKPKCVSVFSAL